MCCILLIGLVADDSLFSMLHVLFSYTVEYGSFNFTHEEFFWSVGQYEN